MSRSIQSIESYTTPQEVSVAQNSTDAQPVVGRNKQYKIFNGSSSAGTVTFPNVFYYKTPFCAYVGVFITCYNPLGNVFVIRQHFQINDAPAGIIGQQSSVDFLSQSAPGNSVTLSKNPSNNSLDVSFTTVVGGTYNYTVEVFGTFGANF